jgi:hypothetical protein
MAAGSNHVIRLDIISDAGDDIYDLILSKTEYNLPEYRSFATREPSGIIRLTRRCDVAQRILV